MGLISDPVTGAALLIGVMSAVAMLLVAAAFTDFRPRQFRRRLHDVAAQAAAAPISGATQTGPLLRRGKASSGLDRAFRLLPRREVLAERLAKTGLNIGLGQYVAATVATILALLLLLTVAAGFGLAASIMFATALGLFIPHHLVGRMGRKRVANFIALFPEAIDLMVRALRAGLPITEAVVNAGREIGDPVGSEFQEIEAGMRLGRDLESLLWDIAKRIPAPEFRFFIIALSVQRETGGNLAETLNNLSEVLRRRRAMRAKARAMASEARASTMILGSLPILVTIVLSFTTPGYIAPLFTDVRGLMLVALAIGMLVIGITVMVKMARFEI